MVRFSLPSGIYSTSKSAQGLNTARTLSYWAEGTTLPSFGVNYMSASRYGYGAMQKRPIGLQYQDIQVTFISDEQGDNWQFIYDWLNIIINNNMFQGITGSTGEVNVLGLQASVARYEPYELGYRQEFLTDLEIMTFSQTGEQIQSIMFREAYPVAMGGVDFNWAAINEYTRLPVTFTYTDMAFLTPTP